MRDGALASSELPDSSALSQLQTVVSPLGLSDLAYDMPENLPRPLDIHKG
jgi:hypothetical protein